MLDNKNQQETDALTINSPDTLTKVFIMRHLNKGAKINETSSDNGKSILTIAAQGYIEQYCNLDMVGYLLARGADPFSQDNNGNSMFSIATKNSNKQLLKVITEYIVLRKDIIALNCKIPGTQGKTPMHIIAELGEISQFLVLLKAKGRVDINDGRGNAPLDIIASGINRNFLDIPEKEAIKKLKIVERNLKHYPSVSENQLLELKICIRNFLTQQVIMDSNISQVGDEESYNQDATNKLISLCCKSIFSKKQVMQLIEKGADINGFARDSMILHTNGRSPLTMLVRDYLDPRFQGIHKKRLFSYIQVIIECGGNLHKTDVFGDSAISLAHQNCDNELLRMMILKSAELYRQPQTTIDADQPSTSCGHIATKPQENVQQPSTSMNTLQQSAFHSRGWR